MDNTFGVIETKGFSAVLSAAENILENKNIQLLKIEKTGGGIVSAFFEGDFENLTSSFNDGIKCARLVGEIVSTYILSNSAKKLERYIINADKLIEENPESAIAISKVSTIAKKKPERTKTKESKEINAALIKNKPIEFSSSMSTIQRLRKEALAAESSAKEGKAAGRKRSGKSKAIINLNKIDGMNVHELRQLARKTKDFPIRGREISKANRKELISYFKELE